MSTDCPVCGGAETRPFFALRGVPVHCNRLHPTRAQALAAPTGDLRLHFCGGCGHVFNAAFDPALVSYAPDYENSLHFSASFDAYARGLAMDLIERHDCRGKQVVEIGCGQGDFLRLLCDLGGNRGLGFDPSHRPAPGAAAGNPTIVAEHFTAQNGSCAADLVCCRHVLEHIAAPLPFLRELRRALDRHAGPLVFFEVPNAAFTLYELGVWDLIYEHCGYFGSHSLSHAFRAASFEVLRVGDAFGKQFLTIEAVPGAAFASPAPAPATALPGELHRAVEDFAARFRERVDHWNARLGGPGGDAASAPRRPVVWGAGSKGVSFLNATIAGSRVQYVVDINPRKHGKFVAGAGQQIVPAELLRDYRPDLVIVMNPAYGDEIRARLESLGVRARVESV